MKIKKVVKSVLNNIKAFTLIELLVVVLIIGILAAIAVPKYQLAVDKSHFANLQAQVKAIKSSFDNYYLATGDYPDSFDKLDIGFSGYTKTNSIGEECYIFKDSYCCVGKHISNYQTHNIFCGMNDYSFAYAYYNDNYFCVSATTISKAERLCKSYSTNGLYTMKLITPYGHNNNNGNAYNYYLIK